MNLKCLIGLHNWKGCSCAGCSKPRDEGHDWSTDCEKCSVCRKTRESAHNWAECKCLSCGKIRNENHEFLNMALTCSRCGSPADVNNLDNDGNSLLHTASAKGLKNIVDLLIDRGSEIDAKDGKGKTPLHHACKCDHKDVVTLLINRGAAVNIQDAYGETPLHTAAAGGHRDTAETLIRYGADVSARAKSGFTPLHNGVLFGHKYVVILLLAEGANVNAKEDVTGCTPLHFAVDCAHKEIVKILIAKGADLYAKDNTGHLADVAAPELATTDEREIAELLIAARSGRAEKVDTERYTTESTTLKTTSFVIICSRCHTTYNVGVDVVAVSMDDIISAGRAIVLGGVPSNTPILVDHADPGTPNAAIQASKEKIIKFGSTVGWCCKKCGMSHVNRL